MPAVATDDAPTFTKPEEARGHVPGRVLVRFESAAIAKAAAVPAHSSSQAKLESLPASVGEPLDFLRREAGLRSIEPVFAEAEENPEPAARDRLATIASVRDVDDVGAGVAVLDLPDENITDSLLKEISASPAVEAAEQLPARWLCAAPVPDPDTSRQWALQAIQYFEATRPEANNVRVGVIDSGIDTSHPDLPKPALYRHDNYVEEDPVGHGTHVAGVIAALTNNAVGITGICDCELASWKVFPDDPNDPYIDSPAFLRALGEVVSEGVEVVNLSLAGSAHSVIEAGLFARAMDRGVTFVAAMGNEYEEGNPISYPAAYENVISVGAVDREQARSSFSNTGEHIDLCAPGSEIFSTLPTTKSVQRAQTDYASWSGTSMAAPHVTATAALLIAEDPGQTPAEIATRLRDTAVAIPAMNGAAWTEEHGTGLLNLRAALA
jgi:subtilisin family serine protease